MGQLRPILHWASPFSRSNFDLMKAACIIVSVFCSILFFGFDDTANRIYCLEISGKVIAESVDHNEYKAFLMKDSVVLDSLSLEGKQSFKFLLKRKDHYVIRIKKVGFMTRTITIDTNIEDHNYHNDLYKLRFDIDLLDLELIEGISRAYFSEPTQIYFNNKACWFSYSGKARSKEKSFGFGSEIVNVFQCK
jgi:hypothetical protein